MDPFAGSCPGFTLLELAFDLVKCHPGLAVPFVRPKAYPDFFAFCSPSAADRGDRERQ